MSLIIEKGDLVIKVDIDALNSDKVDSVSKIINNLIYHKKDVKKQHVKKQVNQITKDKQKFNKLSKEEKLDFLDKEIDEYMKEGEDNYFY